MSKCNRFGANLSKNYNIQWLLDLVCPYYCQGCGKIGVALCACCKKYIFLERHKNRLEIARSIGELELSGFDSVYVVGLRKGLLYKVIKNYKYEAMRGLAGELADILVNIIPRSGYIVVPLPTIARHIRERSFDHMDLLAQEVCRRSQNKLLRALERASNAVQVGASSDVRLAQAKEAYRGRGGVDPELRYLLLDDVMTTGASMKAARQVLEKMGAKHISAAVLAISE